MKFVISFYDNAANTKTFDAPSGERYFTDAGFKITGFPSNQQMNRYVKSR
jgi:hypothetical protein